LAEVSVRDYNAHAWVEVYFDYIGWVPVEFTPGSTVDYNRTVVADMDDVSRSLKKEEQEAQQEEQLTSQTPSVITPEIPLQFNNAALQQEKQGSASGKDNTVADALYLIFIIATIILLVIFYLLYRRNIANRARTIGSYNKRAIYLYGEIEKMLIFCRCLPKRAYLEDNEANFRKYFEYIEAESLKQLMIIVRKARFGQGVISDQEFEKVIQCRNRLYHRIYGELSTMKRFRLSLRLSL
jgi:uncharacterized membrane protein